MRGGESRVRGLLSAPASRPAAHWRTPGTTSTVFTAVNRRACLLQSGEPPGSPGYKQVDPGFHLVCAARLPVPSAPGGDQRHTGPASGRRL